MPGQDTHYQTPYWQNLADKRNASFYILQTVFGTWGRAVGSVCPYRQLVSTAIKGMAKGFPSAEGSSSLSGSGNGFDFFPVKRSTENIFT